MNRTILAFVLALLMQIGGPFPGPGTPHSAGGGGTFTATQKVFSSPCSTSSTTCAVTVSAIGTGHGLMVGVGYASGVQDTITGVACTSSACGTFVRSTGAASYSVPTSLGTEMGSIVSTTSGGTTVTVTMSASPTIGWDFNVREYSYSGASMSFDSGNSGSIAACTTACTGPTLTLSGTNDVIMQEIAPNASCSAVASPFINGQFTTNGDGYADQLNTASGTGPTWTCSLGVASVAGIGIKGN